MNKLFVTLLVIGLILPTQAEAVTHPVFGAKAIAVRTTTGTRYTPFFGGALVDANSMRQPVGAAGTISDLTAQVTNAPGVGNSYVISLYKNNVITGLTCTIADTNTSCSDPTNSVSVAAGDDVTWATATVGTTGASTFTIAAVFEGLSTAEALIGGTTAATTNTDGFYSVYGGAASTTESAVSVIAPTGFILDKLYCRVTTAPGAGTSFAYTLYLNGSPTSLGCTISGTGLTDNDLTDSVTVAAGDTISMQFDAVNSPTARTQNWGMRLRPTIAGEYPLMSASSDVISTTLQRYANPWFTGAGFSSESTGDRVSPLAFTWRKLYAFFNPAPGSGKSWSLITRKNGANGAQSAVVSDTAQSAQETSDTDSIAAGDSIALSTTPSGSPASVLLSKFSSVAYVAPPAARLLDTIVPPTFAFSLSRYLRAAEEGNPVVRLREDNTNTEQDFKLSSMNELVTDDVNEDTVDDWLTAHGAGNPYVVYLYDQSGNGRTFGTTTTTQQPLLVVNSQLNNLPAIDFSSAEYRLESTSSITITSANGIEVHALVRPTGTINTSERYLFSNGAVSLAYAGIDLGCWQWQADSGDTLCSSTSPVSGTNYQVGYRYTTSANYIINENGVEVLNGPAVGSIDWRSGTQVIGNSSTAASDRPWNGLIAELIFYNGSYSAEDVDDIELSMQTQGGLVSSGSSLPYRVYNLGKMLLNKGTFILQ